MFEIIGFIALVCVVIKVISLSGEVNVLKSDIQKLDGALRGGSVVSAQQTQQTAATSMPAQPLTTAQQSYISLATSVPETPNRFGMWLKENWLLKLGVLMILIAFGWFLSYAFINDWIGPVGRVVLGFVAGSLLAVFGTMRMPKNSVQGSTFLILGSAIVVLTSFASQVAFGFFTPAVAVFIPFIVALYVATVAATYNKLNIGIYAVLMGFMAPILTHGEKLDVNLLFIYLAVMSVACVWLAIRKNWRVINALSLAGVFVYALAHVFTYNFNDNYFIMMVLFGLGAVYFAVSMLSIVKSKLDASASDVFVAIFNSVLIMLVTMAQAPEEVQSLILAAWMLAFGMGSLYVFSKTGKQTFFYIYSLIAVAYLATATAIELQGTALIFTYAIETAAIAIASYLVTKRYDIGQKMSFLMIGPAAMALPSFGSYRWSQGIYHEDFMIIFVTGLLLMLVGGFYYLLRDRQTGEKNGGYAIHVIVGSAYLLGLLWTALHAGLESRSQAVMTALVIYSILGIICYFSGRHDNNKVVQHYGGTLLVLVVLRLVFVDVWNMPLAMRIVTFMIIGAMFVSTAFIGRKKQLPTA